MRFVQRRELRKVYVMQEGDLYLLSPLAASINNYRPIQQFGSREELDQFLATVSNVEVIWQ